jgi:AraC-like DNA-binding protein
MIDVEMIEHDDSDLHAFWLCRFEVGDTGGWGVHRHEQHQIAWVAQGTCTVVAPGGAWVATPARAVWVPSDCPHDIHIAPGAELFCLYLWPGHCPLSWCNPTELAVTPLVRELLLQIGKPGLGAPVGHAYATVLFDQFARQLPPRCPTLPMPGDARAADVARAILANPACGRTLEEWADAVATSASTLRRAFLTDTSMTFSEWRARARLDAALPLLANGLSTERVALRVGYASRSGFVDAYRRHFGHPPAP